MTPGPSRTATREAGRVSESSAERFAARVRARRRRRTGLVLGAATVVTLAGWALLGSSWLDVDRIEVSGTVRVDPAAVREAASAELGEPLLLARTSEVAARVGELPLVRDVEVERSWPSALRVVVTERRPVAAARDGQQFVLVDGEGVEVARQAGAPQDLPVLDVSLDGAGAAVRVRAGTAVVAALPADLRAQVRRTVVGGPDSVQLDLRDGSRVVWGGADRSADKARVLTALLKQKAAVYDVSAPDAPALRRER